MGRLRPPGAALAGAAAGLAFLLLQPPAARTETAPPPSLEGEQLYAVDTITDVKGTLDISGACTAAVGEKFTLTYRATGTATGPYEGPYTESGTVTGQPLVQSVPGNVTGVVVSWTATFTIDSPTGQVTGRKTLTQELSTSRCIDARTGFLMRSAFAILQYEATITPPTGGTFADAGKANAVVESFDCLLPLCIPGYLVFQENFYLSTGVLPLDTSGKATGGGQMVPATDPTDHVTFGFNVKQQPNGSGFSGSCNVLDHATRTKIKCLTATGYAQGGNTASWSGSAEVNGAVEPYRITVQDNGEPNQGADTFWITTQTFEAAGPVQRGNVQLH